MQDLTDIKRKCCVEYLESQGHRPDLQKSSKQYTFYKSPFRDERTASFSVNNSRNTWFDYGAGFGGDVIKLVQLVENVDFKEALQRLGATDLSSTEPRKKEAGVEVLEVQRLSTGYLLAYLRGRGINVDLARLYCKELVFIFKGKDRPQKRQRAIGFQNDSGGWEIRNKYLKIGTSPKDITSIEGEGGQNVFEGFIDFLSLISKYRREPKEKIIVLNSVSLIGRCDFGNERTKFFGDNDAAGDRCLAAIPGAKDMRHLYAGFKDINDWLLGKR